MKTILFILLAHISIAQDLFQITVVSEYDLDVRYFEPVYREQGDSLVLDHFEEIFNPVKMSRAAGMFYHDVYIPYERYTIIALQDSKTREVKQIHAEIPNKIYGTRLGYSLQPIFSSPNTFYNLFFDSDQEKFIATVESF